MKWTDLLKTGLLALALSLTGAVMIGCEQDAGDHLEDATDDAGDAAESVGDAVEEGVEDVEEAIDD